VSRRVVAFLLWGLVGVTKAAALIWLVTDADRLWPQILAALLLALALVGAALWLRRDTAD
jgi:hypothetical protein